MTDANDSSFLDSSSFGKNNNPYESKRHYDEFEPFAQPLPPSAEPLFPTAIPASDNPTDYSARYPTGYKTDNLSDSSDDRTNGQSALYSSNSYQDGYAVKHPTEYASDQGSAHASTTQDDFAVAHTDDRSPDGLTGQASDYTADQSWTVAMPDSLTYQQNQGYPKYTSQSYDHLFSMTDAAVEQKPVSMAPFAHTTFGEPAPTREESLAYPVAMAAAQATEAPPQLDNQPLSKPVASERDLLFDRHFAVLTDLMQHGAWPQAAARIQAMRAEYPGVKTLDSLLHEATLKAELMAHWTPKIKGRRLTVGQEFLIRRSLPFLFLLVLFVSGVIFYRIFLAPSREVLAMERANQALVQEAAGLVQSGQIDEAIQLYNTVLSRDPNNDAAQQGLLEANHQTGLSVIYDIAIRVANSGNLKRSLLMLESIKTRSPNFRDIDARLQRVNSLLVAEQSYQAAEKAFVEHRWVNAIANYEQTQVLAPDYQAIRVASQISAAYFFGAQKLMLGWPSDDFGPDQIRDFLRKAQEINSQDQTLAVSLADLDDIIRGERSLKNNNVDDAIKAWRGVYDKKPGILGGYLAEQLYRAYLTLATGLNSSDAAQAKELYTAAASLAVSDSGEARAQLQSLGAPLPPVQPTPLPQPTLSLDPAIIAAAAAPAPNAAATPTPSAPQAAAGQPTPSALWGWIAFRTTRDGTVQVYIMRGDGSEQKPAPDDVRVRLDAFYQEEQRSPDGRLLTVQNANGRGDTDIFITNSDGSQNTPADSTGDESDPVWSSTGDSIAFVSNRTGNDEVWMMRGDGSQPQQLTSNTWEWDKHPTWSPDSSQIAFFSNRSGHRQIWVMNSDGSKQYNLSNNSYDDWDPVWLK